MTDIKNKTKNTASVAKTNQNKKQKIELTPFEKEQLDTLKKINEFKLAAEASAVASLYKKPDLITQVTLKLEDLTNNEWRVFYAIAYGVVVTENKNSLSDVDVNFYLEKHPKLREKFESYGGYDTIQSAKSYVSETAISGYVDEIKKWNTVIELAKFGFPVKDKLKEYVDQSLDSIYRELEGYLNHVFANADSKIKTYNALSDLHELVDDMNKGEEVGLPFTSDLLTKEIGGLRKGHIYSFIGSSGAGKSTVVMNTILPQIISKNQRCCIYINEEDVTKVRRELLVFCCRYILNTPIKKVQLRDGKFDEKTLETLHKAADWLESQDKNHNITVIPLERYTVKTVTALIKKYKNLFDVDYHIVDTLKESSDSTEETWKSMLKDSTTLYDCIKPAGLNVCLVVTMQMAKSSMKNRHLTLSDIGQSRSVADVMSVCCLLRKAEQEEYKGGKKELKCFRLEGTNKKSKIPFYLEEDKYYLILFLGKNRFGVSDSYSLVWEVDYSTNLFKDLGYTIVPEDW